MRTIRTPLKDILDFITHPLGLDISRHFGKDLGLKEINKILLQQSINVLLDVGANTGQYAISLIKTGYTGKIISFEPLDDAWEKLKSNASNYSNWYVYERTAIGDYCGSTLINVSANRESSSILPVNETHTNVVPSAKPVNQLQTPIVSIDSIFSTITNANDKICLKIDTQGFEEMVLNGAAESLQNIRLIQTELSLVPLYAGSKTIEFMVPFLKSKGFEPVFYLPGFVDRTTGILQQLEGLFINTHNG